MSKATDRDLESAVISQLMWRLLPFLFLLYIVAYLDRINVGFAALQMREQLHFNDSVYGLGAAMFFAGYFCFQLPSNLMLQRIGARRWISVLMITWGVISASMILVTTPRSFYTMRFLLGLAEAGFFPGVILYLKSWVPAVARARTVAWFMTAAPLAGVIGGPISGALLGLHGKGLQGWQWLFLIEGIPAVVLGAIVFFYLNDNPEKAHWLGREQCAWLLDALKREQRADSAMVQGTPFSAFKNGGIWLMVFVYFGINTCTYGLSLWLPSVIKSLSGVSTFVIGLLSAIPYVAAAIAMVLVGLNSDRTGERRWHLASFAFIGAMALLIAAYSTSVTPMIAALTVAVLAEFAMMGPFWAMSTSLLTGTASAAGIALINSVGNLGGFFGPSVIGWIRKETGSFKGGLLVVGAAMVLSGCLVLLVRSQGEETT